MKKWFVIALLSVMMLCTISAQAENTKIVFWHSMSEEAGTLMDSYVKSFNETIGKEQGIEVEAVFHRELQAGGAVGVRADGVAVHEKLQEADEHRREHGGNEHARADGEADARRDPDAGRGGETLDRAAVFEDDARAQEADAADDLRRDARGVRALRAGIVHAVLHQIDKAVFGHDHHQRRGAADDDVRADARLLEPAGPLNADRRAAEARDHEPQAKIQMLRKRKLAVEVG